MLAFIFQMLFWTSVIYSLPVDLTQFGECSKLKCKVNQPCKQYFKFLFVWLACLVTLYVTKIKKIKRFTGFPKLRKSE